MTRTALPYSAPDLSALARLLERALLDHHVTHGRLPGHVEMMNLLARGAGFRNLQALQAAATPKAAAPPPVAADAWFDAPAIAEPETGAPAQVAALSAHAKKALEHFDAAGRLERWPQKLSVQRLAMWVLWTRFDARRVYTEREVNQILKGWHLYGDHVTLRRELINHQLMARKSDCSEYRKLAQEPDDAVRALLQALRSPARRAPKKRSQRPPSALPAIAPATPPQAAGAA
jgi:hypothetical protein